MEDNKKNLAITDEDIRKAVDCCITKECDECPFNIMMCDGQYALIWAQDLIKRQDAELERKVDEQKKYHKAILVLQAIAQHRGSHGRGSNEYFDEWTQAAAFKSCREAALRCLKSLGEPVTMTNKRNGR